MSTFWEVPLNVCLHFLCAFHLFPTMALYCHSASSAVQFAFLSPLVAPAWRELSMSGSCLRGSHGMPGTPPFLQDMSKFSSQHFKHEKDNCNQQLNPCFYPLGLNSFILLLAKTKRLHGGMLQQVCSTCIFLSVNLHSCQTATFT